MTNLVLPSDWPINRFEMRVTPNARSYPSLFSPAMQQDIDLLGDYWIASFTINAGRALPAGAGAERGAAIEALLNRLNGPMNRLLLSYQRRPFPLGTLRDDAAAVSVVNASLAAVNVVNASAAAVSVVGGSPTTAAPIAQWARTGLLLTRTGRTLKAGDLFKFLATGTVHMQLVDTVADGAGVMPIEFAPAVRAAIPGASAISVTSPTVAFKLKDGRPPPVVWRPGGHEAVTVDLIEAL